jgi:hypothetical protein
LPGIDELKAAGLLDPVDAALEELATAGASQEAEAQEGEQTESD